MPRLLDRYVLREVVPPFLLGLLLVTFVLLMNQVLLLADLFIDKGVPWLQALRLLVLLVPSILVFALPMAVLMGVVGGLARLSADSEIVALRSARVGRTEPKSRKRSAAPDCCSAGCQRCVRSSRKGRPGEMARSTAC